MPLTLLQSKSLAAFSDLSNARGKCLLLTLFIKQLYKNPKRNQAD